MRRYDVYLAHASEDGAVAEALRDSLHRRGLSVWFNAFIVGPTIRRQMEDGLRNSEYGLVLLSPRFFFKRWAVEELEGMLALEEVDNPRILPVWWGVDFADVRSHSPMLSMRSAAVLGGHDEDSVDLVAGELLRSILHLNATKGPAHQVRAQIQTGLPWAGVQFEPESFRLYHDRFEEEFAPAYWGIAKTSGDEDQMVWWEPLVRGVDGREAINDRSGAPVPPEREPVVTDLPSLVRNAPGLAGQRVCVIAHQVPGSVQILDMKSNPLALQGRNGEEVGPVGLAAFVFQIVSRNSEQPERCYVHCIGPYLPSRMANGPIGPPGWLCWVQGVVLAVGNSSSIQGSVERVAYLVASDVRFTPTASLDEDACGDVRQQEG